MEEETLRIGRNHRGEFKNGEIGTSARSFKDIWLICDYGRLEDVNKNCLDQFRKHWQCLENNNQSLWHCRRPEQLLNACVFEKLVRLPI